MANDRFTASEDAKMKKMREKGLTVSEIAEAFEDTRSEPSVRNRIHRLQSSGYITSPNRGSLKGPRTTKKAPKAQVVTTKTSDETPMILLIGSSDQLTASIKQLFNQ